MSRKMKTRFNGVIELGDHLVVLYNNESDITETIVSYISNSLNKNVKTIYINGDTDTNLIIESLKEIGMYKYYIENNQLEFFERKDAYSKDGIFNPEKMKNLLIELAIKAQKDGYNGLAISGEISWVLEYENGFDLINEYEWKINSEVFDNHPVTALCRYNMDKFSNEMIINVIQLHPLLIIENKVYENPFYIPAIAYENNNVPEYQVKTWLTNIVKFSNTQSEFNERLNAKDLRTRELELVNKELELINKRNISQFNPADDVFGNIITGAPIPIMIHAEDGTVLSLSKKWTELTLYKKSDIPTIFEWTYKAYGKNKAKVQEFITKLYRLTETQHDGEFIVSTKDGRKLNWDFHSGFIGNLPDGRAVAMSVATDITDRRKRENENKVLNDKIKSTDTLLRSSLESFKDIFIWAVDKNYCYLYFNESFKTAIKKRYNKDIIIGSSLINHISKKEQKIKVIKYHDMSLSGNYHTVIDDYGDKEKVYYETSYSPIFDEKNNIIGATGFSRDITSRINHQSDLTHEKELAEKYLAELKEAGNIFENSIINAPVPIMVHSDDGTVINFSDTASKLTGYTKDDIKTIYDWTELAYGKNKAEVIEFITSLYSSPNTRHEGEFEVRAKDGRKLIWDFTSGVIGKLPNGKAVAMSVATDVTELTKERKNLVDSFDRLDRSQKISNVGSWELDLKTNLMWGSQEAFNIYELSRNSTGEINISNIKNMVSSDDLDILDNALANLIQNDDVYDVFYTLNIGDKKKYIHSKATMTRDDAGKPIKVLGVIRDITILKQKEDELFYISYHDSLTGLYNRRYLENQLIKLDNPKNYPLTVVMSDINGLKLINDAFGHNTGDRLLVSAANLITEACRETDLIARIGGDEFIIVMPNTNEEEAEKIIDKVNMKAKKIQIEAIELSISFGFATKKEINEDIQETYRTAEDLMYRVKLLEIPSMRSNAIETILNTLYEKDINSEIHCRTVSEISEKLALSYGMNRQEINEVKTAGLLHDIGKIIIPISIIVKKGKLSKEEYKLIKSHPEIGFRILNSTHNMRNISNIVLNHHERWDGQGYPRGIKSNDIPLQSRIISIADAFDAMTSERTYRKTLSKDEALLEIVNNSGTQFDPELVNIFKENFAEITKED